MRPANHFSVSVASNLVGFQQPAHIGSASVMGPRSSSSECIRSPVSCFCPWSAVGRHLMLSEGVAEQSSERGLGIAPGHCRATCLTISASRRRDLVGACRLARSEPCASLPLCSCCRGRILAPDEFRPVRPNPMENSGQLTCQRHLCPPHSAPLGDVHRPALERAEFGRPR